MMRGRTSFDWPVFTSGYRFVRDEAKPSETPRLFPSSENPALKWRQPLTEAPGLHRTFASLETTEGSIEAFANEWGMLVAGGRDTRAVEGSFELQTTWLTDEGLDTWTGEIQRMRGLLGVWDGIRSGDKAEIFRVVESEIERTGNVVLIKLRFKPSRDVERVFSLLDSELGGLGDLKGAAFVSTMAHQWLFELVSEQLASQCSPSLFLSGETGKAAWQLQPNTLRTALWVLFAQEVLGETKLRQCPTCWRWFDLLTSEEGERTSANKVFCSNACSMKAYRQRQEKARELYANGKTPAEIAKELGVETKSVQTWVKGSKGKK